MISRTPLRRLFSALPLLLLAAPPVVAETSCAADFLSLKPTSDEVDAYAGIYLQKGQLEEVTCLLDEYYGDGPRSVPSYALEAMVELLRVQLREDSATQGFDTPRELLERQTQSLNKGLDAVELGTGRLRELRRSLPADRYKTLRVRLLIVEARLRMALGDESYRLLGARLASQAGDMDGMSTALVEYGRARERIYLCLLLDAPPEALELAQQIDRRIDWINKGRFFGGLRFFELNPFVDGPAGSDWNVRVRLKELLDGNNAELRSAYNSRLKVLEDGDLALQALARRLSDKEERTKDRNERRAARLYDRLADLRRQAAELDVEEQRAAEQELHNAMVQFQNNTQLRQDLEHYLQALKDRRRDEIQSLSAALTELKKLAGREEIAGLPGLKDKSEPLMDGLRKLASENTDENTVLATLLQSWRPRSSGEGSLSEFQKDIETRAALVRTAAELIEQARLDLEDQIRKIEQTRLEKEIATVEEEMRRQERQFRAYALAQGDDIQRLQSEMLASALEHIEGRKKEVQDRIQRARDEIRKAQEFFSRVQKGKEEVERAITAARSAIVAAGNIPSGIITGTAAGTFTNYPTSLMEAAKAGMQLVEFAAQAEMSYEEIRAQIRKIEREVEGYKAQLDGLTRTKLEEQLKQELERERQFLNREQARVDAFLAVKRNEAQAKVREISELTHQMASSGKQRVESVLRQHEAELEQVRAEFERATDRYQGSQYRAADQVFLLLARLAEIERLRVRIQEVRSDRDGMLQAPPSVSEDREPSGALQLTREQIRQVTEAIAEQGANPETLDVAEVLELSHHGASVLELSDHYQRKLEETNQALFGYANWLYFVTGDPRVLDWAVWCRTVSEAQNVWGHLNEIYRTLMREMTGSQPQSFAVQLRPEDLERRALPFALRPGGLPAQQRSHGGDEIWFRVSSFFPEGLDRRGDFTSIPRPRNQLLPELRAYFPAGRAVDPQAPLRLEELVFWPQELANNPAPSYLFDAYVIPDWKRAVADGLPHHVSLEPVGPTAYRIGDSLREHPWYGIGSPNHASTAATWRDFHQKQQDLYASVKGPALVSSPFSSHNYPVYMGRGIDNIWKLIFPRGWGIEKLERLTVVFTYFTRTTNIATAAVAAAGPSPAEAEAATRDPAGESAGLQARRTAYLHEKSWYGPQGNDFESSPVAASYRLEQLANALDLLPDVDTLLGTDSGPSTLEGEAAEIGNLLIDVPVPSPGVDADAVDRLVEQVVHGQVLAQYDESKPPVFVNQIPLKWFAHEVFEVLDGFKDDLETHYLPDLEAARKTLEEGQALLVNPKRLAQRVNWEHERLLAQKAWLAELRRLFENVRTPRLSAEDEQWLRQATQWAAAHGKPLAIARERLAGHPETIDYLLELLLTTWRRSLEWRTFGGANEEPQP